MQAFVRRHQRPLRIWAWLAGTSLYFGAVAPIIFTLKVPLIVWMWLIIALAFSWGVPVGAWIICQEIQRWLERRCAAMVRQLRQRRQQFD